VDELVRRLVFGVCTGNNDMHLKNWALTYPGGR
jgi:serine/threonine protein kinase HipA of HipAB toxin-antitoxin module